MLRKKSKKTIKMISTEQKKTMKDHNRHLSHKSPTLWDYWANVCVLITLPCLDVCVYSATPMEISQSNNVEEAGAGLSDLFAVSQTDNADDFNAANVLNISVNSNGMFLFIFH